MTHLVSRHRLGFKASPIHRSHEPHAFHYLAQRTSFWVAVLSLLAFVTGNMIGQHGWQVFWKSVLGRDNDSLIVYTGTVTPIALVPDYMRWTQYGGNPQEHTFREVPQDLLIPLPPYTPSRMSAQASAIYSVSYLGSYVSGVEGTGSHPAVDIRVPIGTPVRSIASGIVSEVKDATGFGKTVVIRHPNIPDPDNPRSTTVLYSNYAHLSTTFVEEGDIVSKGDQIALSGMTGDATGPHLHFQIDQDTAPWHPYWPFTAEELRTAGLSTNAAVNRGFHADRAAAYTVNPLLFVQADYEPVITVAKGAAPEASSSASSVSSATWISRTQSRIAQRKALRLVQTTSTVAVRSAAASSAGTSVSTDRAAEQDSPRLQPETAVVQRREVVVSRTEPSPTLTTSVATAEITHDGEYSDRGWERVRITLLDAQGAVVTSPQLERDIVLRAAFGSADFQPDTLSVLDFEDGRAEVSVLPHGRRTLIIQAIPFGTLSQPMRYSK